MKQEEAGRRHAPPLSSYTIVGNDGQEAVSQAGMAVGGQKMKVGLMESAGWLAGWAFFSSSSTAGGRMMIQRQGLTAKSILRTDATAHSSSSTWNGIQLPS